MFPNIHALLASLAVTAVVALGAFGVAGASRGTPAEAWRSAASFDERADWNPFANPDTARRYQIMTAVPTPEEAVDTAAIAMIARDLPEN